MTRLLIAGLLALAYVSLWPVPAGAEETHMVEAKCFPTGSIERAAAGVAQDEGTKVLDISGPSAQRYLDVLNQMPPVTAMKAERILIVLRKEGGPTLSIFVQGMPVGCIIGRVKLDVHERALEASKDTPA